MFGSLLFNIYINDLGPRLNNVVLNLYADDIVLLPQPYDHLPYASLQSALSLTVCSNWARSNGLTFSLRKSAVVLFSAPEPGVHFDPPTVTALSIGYPSTALPYVNLYKYLGVIFDSHLNFGDHFRSVLNSLALSSVNILP